MITKLYPERDCIHDYLLTVMQLDDFADVRIGKCLSTGKIRVYIIIDSELKGNSQKYFNEWLDKKYNNVFDLMVFSCKDDKDIANCLGGLSIN